MACKYTYKGITYNSKEEFVNQVVNPQFLGKSNNTLPFIKSNNTIDDDFYIKDELLVKDLQNIRAINWDGSVNTKIDKLKRKYFDFFNNPVVPLSTKVDVSEFTKATRTTLDEVITKANLSESNKILFEKIKPLVKGVTIEYVEEFFNSDSGAVYSDKYNTIRINKSEKSIPLEELLMHELLHAATFRKISYFENNTKGLSKKELAALNELENIRKVLKEASDKYWDNRPRYARSVNPLEGYRTDSIHEIISYTFTNKEFRDAIAEIPYTGNKSILDKLVELIANIFGVKQDTVLYALLANTEVLLENNEVKSTNTKTRRILEVQSDLFQKGRDALELIGDENAIIEELIKMGKYNSTYPEDIEQARNNLSTSKQNQFLQLLNKDSNWVKFFVQAIIQDTAKQTITKVQESDVEAKVKELEKNGLLEIDCKGKIKAEKGLQTNFTKGGKWKLIKDLKGYPTHKEGGVDLTIGKNGVSIKNGNTEFTAKHGLVIPKN